MKIITDDGQEFTVEHVRMARLEPGDIVILKTEREVDEDGAARLKHMFIEASGIKDQKTVVVPKSIDIEILRQKAKPLLWCPDCNEAMESTFTHEYHIRKKEDGFYEQHQLFTKAPG